MRARPIIRIADQREISDIADKFLNAHEEVIQDIALDILHDAGYDPFSPIMNESDEALDLLNTVERHLYDRIIHRIRSEA